MSIEFYRPTKIIVNEKPGSFVMNVAWRHPKGEGSFCPNAGENCVIQAVAEFDKNHARGETDAHRMDRNNLMIEVDGKFFSQVLKPQLEICEHLSISCVLCGQKLQYSPFYKSE